MSKNPKMTAIQLRKLEAYERFFDTTIRAGYCSYPGQEAIDRMLAVWQELTGHAYAFRAGCSTCIFNLVHDIGTLYRAQRPAGWKEKKALEAAAKAAAAKAEAEAAKASALAEGLEPGGITPEAAKAAEQGKAQTENESPAEGAEPGKEEE